VRTFRWGARRGCELACRGEPGSRRALHGERLAAASTAPGVVTHHGGRRRLSRLASTARGGDMRRHTFLCHCWLRGAVGTSVAATAPFAVSSRILPSLSCRRVEVAACVRVGPFRRGLPVGGGATRQQRHACVPPRGAGSALPAARRSLFSRLPRVVRGLGGGQGCASGAAPVLLPRRTHPAEAGPFEGQGGAEQLAKVGPLARGRWVLARAWERVLRATWPG
jgi:hypothetical protein